MKISEIREALKNHPHVKKVWLTADGGYSVIKVNGATEVDLTTDAKKESAPEPTADEVESETTSEETPKPKKKK